MVSFLVSLSMSMLTLLHLVTFKSKEILNIRWFLLWEFGILQYPLNRCLNMKWLLNYARYTKVCLTVLLIFSTLTLILIRNSFLLKEWVCLLKAGCTWGHLQLLMAEILDILTVKWLMEDLLILITTLSSSNLE